MPLLSFCQWLQSTAISTSIRESLWVFPVVEGVHAIGIVLVAGTIVIVDLRLLGFGLRRQPVSSVVSQVLPWTWSGFAFMFLTGFLLVVSEPLKLYHSFFFPIKIAFLLLAGLNALLFHCGIYRSVARWDQESLTPARARLAGLLSIAFWICVIGAGRAIGYELH